MSYFIFDGNIKLNQTFSLDGEEARHLLNSRRIQTGELIEIQDKNHHRFQAKVKSVAKKKLLFLPVVQLAIPTESPLKINLFQAMIKDKYLDLILQKATELGVAGVYFFQSAFSQRLKRDADKQIQRWNKICIEACKQSGRAKPPLVVYYDSIKKTELKLKSASNKKTTLCLATTSHSDSLSKIPYQAGEVNLLVGPEGGWKEGEFFNTDFIPINLGQRILRAETAAIAAVSILQYLYGDLRFFSG